MEIINLKKNQKTTYIEMVAKLEKELWNYNSTLQNYKTSIKLGLKRGNYNIFLALENNIPLGYVETDIFYSWDEIYSSLPILQICGLYVSPIARKQGIATSLIKECENYARDFGCKQIASNYYSFNTTSANLHKKLGFKETSRIINVIKDL